MENKKETFDELYNKIYNIHNEWARVDYKTDPNWDINRYCRYNFGPVLGLYAENDTSLITVINDDYSDEDICSLLIPIKERVLTELSKKLT